MPVIRRFRHAHGHRNIVLGLNFDQVQTDPARPRHSKVWQLLADDSTFAVVCTFDANSDYMRRFLHAVRD